MKLAEDQVHSISRALAAPRRAKMLEKIATLDASIACQRLLELHGISAATLSHHLKELEMAGLI